ncbi:MAG: hypothetical protein GC145_19520 [Caulobacter sp.]|nr:hypothetical protein [Caulobacter sp.]
MDKRLLVAVMGLWVCLCSSTPAAAQPYSVAQLVVELCGPLIFEDNSAASLATAKRLGFVEVAKADPTDAGVYRASRRGQSIILSAGKYGVGCSFTVDPNTSRASIERDLEARFRGWASSQNAREHSRTWTYVDVDGSRYGVKNWDYEISVWPDQKTGWTVIDMRSSESWK